jgi:hypothetical protein
MDDYVNKGIKAENKWENFRQEYFTLKDIFIYIILASSIFSLGLMNFADFTFDLDRLTLSYVAHTLTQIIAYGAIIGSFSSKQLDKRKNINKELNKLKEYNFKVLEFYRPDKLKEYIDTVNFQTKKDAYLDKYRELLNTLELEYDKLDKEGNFAYDKSWKQYLKDKQENPEAQAPNTYCYKKDYYLEKLANVNSDYMTDNVQYEKLTIEDLTSGVRKSQKNVIPRQSESRDAGFGVVRSMSVMIATSLLTAGFVLTSTGNTIDAIVKSLITVFLAVYSAFKGMMNGERVFYNTTLIKEQFRKHHLHSYSVFEAKTYKFIVGDTTQKNNVETQSTKQK